MGETGQTSGPQAGSMATVFCSWEGEDSSISLSVKWLSVADHIFQKWPQHYFHSHMLFKNTATLLHQDGECISPPLESGQDL